MVLAPESRQATHPPLKGQLAEAQDKYYAWLASQPLISDTERRRHVTLANDSGEIHPDADLSSLSPSKISVLNMFRRKIEMLKGEIEAQ